MKIGFSILAFLFFAVAVAAQSTNEISSLIDKGEIDAASAKVDAILKTRPNDANALTQKVRILVIKKQFAETESLANKLIVRDPKNKVAFNARGVAKRDGKKDPVGALADFDKALAIDAEYPQAAFNRALTLYSGKIGKKSDALDAFSFAIELNPENSTARAVRGRLLNEFGRHKLALIDLNKAASTNKTVAVFAEKAYSELMLAISGEGSLLEDANRDAEAVLRAEPANSTALAVRSVYKLQKNDRDGAAADAQNALQSDPNTYLAHITLGYIKRLNKDLNGAFAEFEAAHKLNPNSPWTGDELYKIAGQARETNPKAAAVYREQQSRKIANSRKQLEFLKLVVEAEPWDYNAYEKLDKSWSDLRNLIEKANDRITYGGGRTVIKDVPEYDVEVKAVRDYWYDLHTRNPKNVCVGFFKYGYFDRDENGLYDQNRKKHDSTKLNYLKGELANYDGTNGAECAARLALFIANIYQTPYSTEKNFDLAKQFAERSKQIKADLKDDPNTISGVAMNADESLKETAYWKAQDDGWKKELEAMKLRAASNSDGSARGRGGRSGDPIKERAAIAAFDRVHPQIERLAEQVIGAASKVQSGGTFSNFYRGTRQRMSRLQSEISALYRQFMAQQGDHLPQSMADHLRSDVYKTTGIRNDYTTGEAYQTYQGGGCSNGWSGYGC